MLIEQKKQRQVKNLDQVYYNTRRKPGQHLRYIDRQRLEWEITNNLKLSKKKRKSQAEIAKKLGISRPTLSRELRRGKVEYLDSELKKYTSYSAHVAQSSYAYKSSNKGPGIKIGNDHKLCRILEQKLSGRGADGKVKRRGYSPDAVVMNFDKQGWPTETRICTKTIYNYIAKDLFLHVTQKDLPRKGNPQRRKYQRVKRLGHKTPEGRFIDERPQAAKERLEPGHWEMDCIESIKGDRPCLLTLVDRCTRTVHILKLANQKQESVKRALDSLESKYGARKFRETFKTITVDNGAEFNNWQLLEESTKTKKKRTRIYYASPYSSWERGSNENCNGFIRYFIPKGTKISKVSRRQVKEIQDWINNYPRRLLDGLSAKEYHTSLQKAG